MNQSSYIAAFLVIGFIVFITVRGELRQYLDVLGIATSGNSSSSSGNTAASNQGLNAGAAALQQSINV